MYELAATPEEPNPATLRRGTVANCGAAATATPPTMKAVATGWAQANLAA